MHVVCPHFFPDAPSNLLTPVRYQRHANIGISSLPHPPTTHPYTHTHTPSFSSPNLISDLFAFYTCLFRPRVKDQTSQAARRLSRIFRRPSRSRHPSLGRLPFSDPETFLTATGTHTVVTPLTPRNVRREAKQSGRFLPDAKSGEVKNRSDIKTGSTCGARNSGAAVGRSCLQLEKYVGY